MDERERIVETEREPVHVERETTIINTGSDGGRGGGGMLAAVFLLILAAVVLFYVFGGSLMGGDGDDVNVKVDVKAPDMPDIDIKPGNSN